MGKEAAPAPVEPESAKIRYSAKSVVAQRRSLGISAAEFGKLIGVTGATIYKWEHGTSRPRKAQLAAFAAVRSLGRSAALARLEEMREKAPKKRAAKR